MQLAADMTDRTFVRDPCTSEIFRYALHRDQIVRIQSRRRATIVGHTLGQGDDEMIVDAVFTFKGQAGTIVPCQRYRLILGQGRRNAALTLQRVSLPGTFTPSFAAIHPASAYFGCAVPAAHQHNMVGPAQRLEIIGQGNIVDAVAHQR